MDSLAEKIKGLSLTKTEKIIADYFLDHIGAIGLQTVTELAMDIGVSDTSIIRFIRNLGFTGYTDFKREMNASMRKQYTESLSPGQKYFKTRDSINKDNLITDVLNKSLENIVKTCNDLDMETVHKAAKVLLESKHKYITAFRGTSCCATYMYRKLLHLLPNAICCDKAESLAIEQIIDIEKNDCVLLYSFPRYTELGKTLLEIARRRGAKTIVVTDRVTSPLVAYADIVFTASVEGIGFTNSYLAPMCISEILLMAISGNVKLDNDKRFLLLDEYVNKYNLY